MGDPIADELANEGLDSPKQQIGYSDLPYGEVTEPEFKQIELTPEQADLYGTALMNLITSGLALVDWVKDNYVEDKRDTVPQEVKDVINWASNMNELVNMATGKAGLGMPQ
jgi:hypothetical protein